MYRTLISQVIKVAKSSSYSRRAIRLVKSSPIPGLVLAVTAVAVITQYHATQRCKREEEDRVRQELQGQIDALSLRVEQEVIATGNAIRQAQEVRQAAEAEAAASSGRINEMQASLTIARREVQALQISITRLEELKNEKEEALNAQVHSLEEELREIHHRTVLDSAAKSTEIAELKGQLSDSIAQVAKDTQTIANLREREAGLKVAIKEWKKKEAEIAQWKAHPIRDGNTMSSVSVDSFHAVADASDKVVDIVNFPGVLKNKLLKTELRQAARPKNALAANQTPPVASTSSNGPVTVKFSDIKLRGDAKRFDFPKDWDKVSRNATYPEVAQAVEIRKRYQRFCNESREPHMRLSENYIMAESKFWLDKCRIPVDWNDMQVPQSIIVEIEKARQEYFEKKRAAASSRDAPVVADPSGKGKQREVVHTNGVDRHFSHGCPTSTLDDVLTVPAHRTPPGLSIRGRGSPRGRGGSSTRGRDNRSTATVAMSILEAATRRRNEATVAEAERAKKAMESRIDEDEKKEESVWNTTDFKAPSSEDEDEFQDCEN